MREDTSSIVWKSQVWDCRGLMRFVNGLVAAILCLAISGCPSSPPQVMVRPVTPPVHPTRVLVWLKDGFDINDFYAESSINGIVQFGGEIALPNLLPGLFIVEAQGQALLGSGFDPVQFSSSQRLQTVELMEPDPAIFSGEVPNVDLYTHQWGLTSESARLPGGPAPRDSDIRVEQVWDQFRGNEDFPVAVLDDGIYSDHPDLSGQTLEGIDFSNEYGAPLEDSMVATHGTRVSSIIVGKGFGGTDRHGMAGVAPGSKVIMVKVMGQDGGYLVDALAGLNWVLGHQIRVSSNSWFTRRYSEILFKSLESAGEKGHLFVTVAGNDGQEIKGDSVPYKNAHIFPAGFGKALNNLVVVAAGAPGNTLARFSSWDPEVVHLTAPGTFVLSAMPPDDWSYAFGSSFAAPFVAGAVALALAAEEEDGDTVFAADLTPDAIKQALIDSRRGPLYPIDTTDVRILPGGMLDVSAFITKLVKP